MYLIIIWYMHVQKCISGYFGWGVYACSFAYIFWKQISALNRNMHACIYYILIHGPECCSCYILCYKIKSTYEFPMSGQGHRVSYSTRLSYWPSNVCQQQLVLSTYMYMYVLLCGFVSKMIGMLRTCIGFPCHRSSAFCTKTLATIDYPSIALSG